MFQCRFNRLARQYPLLQRGHLTDQQLGDMARRIAARAGLGLDIVRAPSPWLGYITRIGTRLAIVIDNRRSPSSQRFTLAHEIGHLALGHYRLEGFWADTDGARRCEQEDEADTFAMLALDPLYAPLEHLRDQLRLPL